MMRKKTSPIWQLATDEFAKLIEQSKTIGEVLGFFGMKNHGSNYNTLKKRCDHEGLDFSKFSGNRGNRSSNRTFTSTPLEEILTENSSYSRCHLKSRLLEEGLLENKCYECGIPPEWNGKKLVMVLDHKNGVNNDNRLKNLQLLCPNCNSQTSTFAGKNKRRKKNCTECGKEVWRTSTRCSDCSNRLPKLERRKVIRPDLDVLQVEVASLGYVGVGRKYGVSDKAVRKWLK